MDHSFDTVSLDKHIAKRLSHPEVDYHILGLHYYSDGIYAKTSLNNMEESIKYVEAFREIIKKQKPAYLVHPDVFVLTKGDDK